MRKKIASADVSPVLAGERLSVGVIETGTLSNGLQVVSNHVPYVHSVTVGIWINAGSREDPPGQEGIAHFIEHAVFKGTRRRDYVEIARCIEEAGGYIDAWTTKEQTCIYVRCLREQLGLGIDLLADLICEPTFPEAELEKEKEVVLEEIAGINDTPEELIFEDFDMRAFPGHQLATPILGTEESIDELTGADLRAFMSRNYVPEKMLLAAVGNVDHDELSTLAARHFGHLEATPPSGLQQRKLFDPAAYRPFSATLKKSVCQAQVLQGTVVARDDANYWGLTVLNAMLSSGMSSILNLELREKRGLVYQAYSSMAYLDELTTFNIYAGTDKGKTAKTLQTIGSLFSGNALLEPDESEIEAAKSKILGSMIMGMEKMTRRMSNMAQDIFFFGRYLPPAEKAQCIESVDAAAIARATASLRIPDLLSTLVYRPSR